MEIIRVNKSNIGAFIDYCIANRKNLDDTFLVDEELEKMKPDDEDPSFIALEGGNVIGAVSMKLDPYLLRGNRARFRIFHCNPATPVVYKRLFSVIRPEMDKVEKVFLFLPETALEAREQIAGLGFSIERYAYLLTRKDLPVGEVSLPEGYSFKEFVPGRDEKDYCRIRNIAFSGLAGSETPLTEEEAGKIAARNDYLTGGILFLCKEGSPVGLVRVAREYYNGIHYALIGPIALLPSYQKKGLGRTLLRAGLQVGRKFGLGKAILSVNAENEQAVHLYTSEGFETDECFISYQYKI
ncbi:GNAT family N-acetyltransferase [Neobacillus sp. YIM B06451]|uniref:GNAT family N-acetyltransferase n=1 Tax=Neobacillus sp. YIM B06451 TaxID=3070994 RepID=UPI00292D6559|nr:GNAT family N-acetyltransferase [Neobacillus sp. YIM B06451]